MSPAKEVIRYRVMSFSREHTFPVTEEHVADSEYHDLFVIRFSEHDQSATLDVSILSGESGRQINSLLQPFDASGPILCLSLFQQSIKSGDQAG